MNLALPPNGYDPNGSLQRQSRRNSLIGESILTQSRVIPLLVVNTAGGSNYSIRNTTEDDSVENAANSQHSSQSSSSDVRRQRTLSRPSRRNSVALEPIGEQPAIGEVEAQLKTLTPLPNQLKETFDIESTLHVIQNYGAVNQVRRNSIVSDAVMTSSFRRFGSSHINEPDINVTAVENRIEMSHHERAMPFLGQNLEKGNLNLSSYVGPYGSLAGTLRRTPRGSHASEMNRARNNEIILDATFCDTSNENLKSNQISINSDYSKNFQPSPQRRSSVSEKSSSLAVKQNSVESKSLGRRFSSSRGSEISRDAIPVLRLNRNSSDSVPKQKSSSSGGTSLVFSTKIQAPDADRSSNTYSIDFNDSSANITANCQVQGKVAKKKSHIENLQEIDLQLSGSFAGLCNTFPLSADKLPNDKNSENDIISLQLSQGYKPENSKASNEKSPGQGRYSITGVSAKARKYSLKNPTNNSKVNDITASLVKNSSLQSSMRQSVSAEADETHKKRLRKFIKMLFEKKPA